MLFVWRITLQCASDVTVESSILGVACLVCTLTVDCRHAREFDDHVASKTDDSDRIVCSENFQVHYTCDVWRVMYNIGCGACG